MGCPTLPAAGRVPPGGNDSKPRTLRRFRERGFGLLKIRSRSGRGLGTIAFFQKREPSRRFGVKTANPSSTASRRFFDRVLNVERKTANPSLLRRENSEPSNPQLCHSNTHSRSCVVAQYFEGLAENANPPFVGRRNFEPSNPQLPRARTRWLRALVEQDPEALPELRTLRSSVGESSNP